MRKHRTKTPDNFREIPIFALIDRCVIGEYPSRRILVKKTIVVNMDDFKKAVPYHHSLGYGEETVIKTNPTTVTYQHEIPPTDYVEVYFGENTWYYMYTDDFRKYFGMEPPRVVEVNGCP